MLRIIRQRLHPVAQLRRMDTQVLRGLHIRHAAFLDQPHSLKLELARKLPSLHDPPPAPSKHLTRCLRNRVQAMCRGREMKQFLLATACLVCFSVQANATCSPLAERMLSQQKEIISRFATIEKCSPKWFYTTNFLLHSLRSTGEGDKTFGWMCNKCLSASHREGY